MPKPAPEARKRNHSAASTPPRKARSVAAPAAVDRMVEAVIAAFAHEIRTPLTGVLAVSDLLIRSSLGERERALVEILKNSAEHIVALSSLVIDGIRARDKGLVLQREKFDLPGLAQELAAALEARARVKGLACSTHIADDLPPTMVGDRVRLRAAVENLIDNAVKFTAEGDVHLDIAHADGTLCFAVADSGIGLRPEEIRRLFHPFVQGNDHVGERFGGAGLGLAFVRRVARAMGGDVTVSATPGQGSTFQLTVLLPSAKARRGRRPTVGKAVQPPPRPRPPRPRREQVKLRILCAEDNTFGCVILKTVLAELGHTVTFVNSGAGVVAAVSRRHSYDVILMDIALAGVDGIEATRQIRALPGRPGRIPVIGLSGSAEKEQAARAAGMDAFLPKPVQPAKLAGALDFAIDRMASLTAAPESAAAATGDGAIAKNR